MHEQQRSADALTPDDAVATDAVTTDPVLAGPPRAYRRPGEPHPYVEERRPPNLWLLAIMTAIALLVALAIMALTLL